MITTSGLNLRIGPFNVKLSSNIPSLLNNIYFLYSEATVISDDQFIDFHIKLKPPSVIRRWFRPQVDFYLNEFRPFKPLPIDQTMAFFEWGLNWAISQHAQQYLILHAAVVEKNNQAIILPGMPGAGKSTLCAALAHHGWRLLSDEQALITKDAETVVPLVRPINLKNQSIALIEKFCPDAKFGYIFKNTTKGDICHVKAPLNSVDKLDQHPRPLAIVFPRYDAKQVKTKLTQTAKGSSFIELISHSFNYSILGQEGFERMSALIKSCHCYHLVYSDLNDALATLERLHD